MRGLIFINGVLYNIYNPILYNGAISGPLYLHIIQMTEIVQTNSNGTTPIYSLGHNLPIKILYIQYLFYRSSDILIYVYNYFILFKVYVQPEHKVKEPKYINRTKWTLFF